MDGNYEARNRYPGNCGNSQESSLPRGDIGLSGTSQLSERREKPFLKTYASAGKLEQQALAVRLQSDCHPLGCPHPWKLSAQNGNLRIQNLMPTFERASLRPNEMLHLDSAPHLA